MTDDILNHGPHPLQHEMYQRLKHEKYQHLKVRRRLEKLNVADMEDRFADTRDARESEAYLFPLRHYAPPTAREQKYHAVLAWIALAGGIIAVFTFALLFFPPTQRMPGGVDLAPAIAQIVSPDNRTEKPPTDNLQNTPPASTSETEIEIGAFGIVEEGTEYPYARLPARPLTVNRYRVTCYGPPTFSLADPVSRWPLTVEDALSLAEESGLTGICAVSPDTPWYDRVTADRAPVLCVEGHGTYLCVDRTARHIRNTIDIYNPELSIISQYADENIAVWEITPEDE